jgi:hypothetical protein
MPRRWPDFLIVGAPKAGTTALHRALAQHPELFLSPVKEPKYFLTGGRRPRPGQGPGDAHSAQEWVWRVEEYRSLFAPAHDRALVGESTPLYLSDAAAMERIRRTVPDAKLIVVLRDPVDRAYSNWMHLWVDGLEPEGDFLTAFRLEDARRAAGWAPFWHYRTLGQYGQQLQHVRSLFPAEQVLVLRYRDLVDDPVWAFGTVWAFLGVSPFAGARSTPENTRGYVPPSVRRTVLASMVRGGARLGAHVHPQVWRQASRPLLWALAQGAGPRPALDPSTRAELAAIYRDDVHLLQRVTGRDFGDWLTGAGRGAFSERVRFAGAPTSARVR